MGWFSGNTPKPRDYRGWIPNIGMPSSGMTAEEQRREAYHKKFGQYPTRGKRGTAPSPGLPGGSRSATKDTRLPVGQGDALGLMRQPLTKEVGTPYRGLEFPGGEPAMFGPVPQHMRSDWGPVMPGKSPYLGLQDFGGAGIPYRPSGLDLPADFSPMKPAKEIQYDDVIYEPVSRWDLMEQDYRNQRGDAPFPMAPQQTPAAGSGGATAQPLRPAKNSKGVPVRPGMRTATGPNDPVLGVPGLSMDVTGLNPVERLEVERQMLDPDRRRNLALDHLANGFTQEESDLLEPGRRRNEALNKSTFGGGYTRGRGPGGQTMERAHPVGRWGDR
jgi:hypothetical protein